MVCLLAPAGARAGDVKLAWDAAPGASGYLVHYGPSASNLSSFVDVGNSTQATISGLADCVDWHFGVSAYDGLGRSGPMSALVADWPRPRITSVNPSAARQGTQATLDVVGANFRPTAVLSTENGEISLANVARLDCNRIQAALEVGPAGPGDRPAQVGSFPFRVTNPNGIRNLGGAGFVVRVDPARFDLEQSTLTSQDRLNGAELSRLTANWGGCDHPGITSCSPSDQARYVPDYDFDGDGWIDGNDLSFIIMERWGRCWSTSDRDFTLEPQLDPTLGLVCPSVMPG